MKKSADSDGAETRLPAEMLLRAYQIVVERGEVLADGSRQYANVVVQLDADGYGVTVGDGVVNARVLFHNKVALQTPNRRSLSRFRKTLTKLIES